MGYSKEIFRQAQREIDRRHEAAITSAQQRRTELISALPELSELERRLAATGVAAAKAAMGGGENAARAIERLRKENLGLQSARAELLKGAGLAPDSLTVKYTCTKCSDTGYDGHRRCECMEKLLRQLAYAALGSSSGADDCRFDSFELSYYPTEPAGEYKIIPRRAMEKVLTICKEYARGFSTESGSLLMCGGTGLGKTHLSLAIAGEVTEGGWSALYTTAPSLMQKLQDRQFSRGAAAEDDGCGEAILECDLLIIDDLGAEFSTSFTVAAIYNIVNSRIVSGLPTIINTNFDESVLGERYGDRLLSRLLCTYRPLPFYGEDIRMMKRYGNK